MKRIAEALCVINGTREIPFAPRDICLYKWSLPAVLLDGQTEEAAARIIYFSRCSGQWVGVSWEQMLQLIDDDYQKKRMYDATQEQCQAQCDNMVASRSRYHLLCSLTLGVYRRFNQPPSTMSALPRAELPCSGIYQCGEAYVRAGIRKLLDAGFINRQNENGVDKFWPTQKLATMVWNAQHVRY